MKQCDIVLFIFIKLIAPSTQQRNLQESFSAATDLNKIPIKVFDIFKEIYLVHRILQEPKTNEESIK